MADLPDSDLLAAAIACLPDGYLRAAVPTFMKRARECDDRPREADFWAALGILLAEEIDHRKATGDAVLRGLDEEYQAAGELIRPPDIEDR